MIRMKMVRGRGRKKGERTEEGIKEMGGGTEERKVAESSSP